MIFQNPLQIVYPFISCLPPSPGGEEEEGWCDSYVLILAYQKWFVTI